MIIISKCTEDEMMQRGKDRLILVEVVTPCPKSCSKSQEDITIAILAERYPKTIYIMVAFEFANTVANSTGVQRGLSAKLHYMHLENAQMIKSLSPCNSLDETTQDPYMAWPNL